MGQDLGGGQENGHVCQSFPEIPRNQARCESPSCNRDRRGWKLSEEGHEGLIVLASIIDGICWIIADVPRVLLRVKALK